MQANVFESRSFFSSKTLLWFGKSVKIEVSCYLLGSDIFAELLKERDRSRVWPGVTISCQLWPAEEERKDASPRLISAPVALLLFVVLVLFVVVVLWLWPRRQEQEEVVRKGQWQEEGFREVEVSAIDVTTHLGDTRLQSCTRSMFYKRQPVRDRF